MSELLACWVRLEAQLRALVMSAAGCGWLQGGGVSSSVERCCCLLRGEPLRPCGMLLAPSARCVLGVLVFWLLAGEEWRVGVACCHMLGR
jgi:hypothetical protein